ncbi:MAG: oligoribonuclease [Methylomonas sp.]|nr:MAG: oligoribonuclease [Methylomonas sp.]PPD26906.1 MAG: oligoribonuclease [Methylomonas sp.]PPD38836.1 MAG: oligoribonuclease [Methylomonas sp.]PPD41731.1 MAG: oligoribonuclease [Methylomonas sp.]PPD54489.1 MAG: oligoribonuclease [Methylomonas sp.]
MALDADNLIWIDLEMTGLNPDSDRIIEIATVVTDKHLNILAQGPVLVVHQADDVLLAMDDWNQQHHGESGLIRRVKESPFDEAAAEAQTLAFLSNWLPPRTSPMCGNSICQDRRFLFRHMPRLEAFFHYRNLDVSTVKELAARWAPELKDGFKKQSSHKALDDIIESIDELGFYRQHFFRI